MHAPLKASPPAPGPAAPLQLRSGAGREQTAHRHAAMPQPMGRAGGRSCAVKLMPQPPGRAWRLCRARAEGAGGRCLRWLVWAICCFSALVPRITPGQLLKSPMQSVPAELEDEDGAANLSLFRACPESVRIKLGTFVHFIHSVCPLPRGV